MVYVRVPLDGYLNFNNARYCSLSLVSSLWGGDLSNIAPLPPGEGMG